VRHLTNEQIAQSQDAIHRADYTWIILSIAVGMLSHISRAIRWKMLMAPLGYSPKLSNAFFAVMVGYLANYAINRLGEVTRPGILTRYEKIPFAESFGTVIVERIVDTLCFFLLAVLVFFLQFNRLYDYLTGTFIPALTETFSKYGMLLYILSASGLIALFILIIFRKRIFGMMSGKTKKTWDGFKEGVGAIKKLRSPWLFIFHSFFIWFIYYAMLHICFLCLKETAGLGINCALTALLFGTLSVIITPGGLGAYPAAIMSILALYAVNNEIGLAVGWLVWLSQFVAVLFFGALSLILLPIMNKENDPLTS
jgi:uncharacterized protein (TIRG00374 family)